MPKTETIAFLTQDESARLFHELGDHKRNKAMFLVAYRHGLRASEVGLLQTSDVDFRKLRIMLHRLKGSYSGEHPLQPDEAKALKAHLRSRTHDSPVLFTSNRGDPISRRTLDWLMKTYAARANIPPLKRHFHVLKHSGCCSKFRFGCTPLFVVWALCHLVRVSVARVGRTMRFGSPRLQTANPTRTTVVVVVTDGYPLECDQNVSDIQEMVSEYYAGVQGTYNTVGQPGIRTYMIGIAVGKFNLDAVAQAGGTGSSTIVDSTGAVSELVTALDNITNANISCNFPVPAPPSGLTLDPTLVQVVYEPYQGTNQEIPDVSSATGCNETNGGLYGGWYFDNNTNPTMITLCPCSCANLGAGSIQLRFGCRLRAVQQ